MSKSAVIFANVGTSIIGNYRRINSDDAWAQLKERLDRLDESVDRAADMDAAGHDAPGRALVDDLASWAVEHGESASAELQSIAEIARDLFTTRPLTIHLLATDTIDGMAASRAVRQVLPGLVDVGTAEVHRIGGLQVDDGSEFVRFGLPEYIAKLYELLERHPSASFQRIFNPTGGFKGVVPYLTIVAMLEGAETRYIYERSEDLLELRPLPVSFDADIVQRALPVLAKTAQRDVVGREFIEDALDLSDPLYQSAFASLWTTIDGENFQVSGVGEILRQRHESDEQPVYLSKKARDDWDNLGPDRRTQCLAGLVRLRQPATRRSSKHGQYRRDKSDCACLGRQAHPYRIHFFEDDSGPTTQIRVTRLFHTDAQHEERNRVLDGPGIYRNNFGDWTQFTDWQ